LSQVAELQQMPPLHEQLLDGFLAGVHQAMTAMEPLRVMAGAGANTRDSPACVTDYQPTEADVGGWFDDSSRAKRIYGSHAKPQQQQQQPQRVQFQVQQLQDPLQQQQALGGAGSASSLAAAVAAAEQEAQLQSDAAAAADLEQPAAAAGSGRGRRWLRRQRST
jgi:digalactosyldiacylglycerol synthase